MPCWASEQLSAQRQAGWGEPCLAVGSSQPPSPASRSGEFMALAGRAAGSCCRDLPQGTAREMNAGKKKKEKNKVGFLKRATGTLAFP